MGILKELFEPIIKNNEFLAALIDLKAIKEKDQCTAEEKRHNEIMSALKDIEKSLQEKRPKAFSVFFIRM